MTKPVFGTSKKLRKLREWCSRYLPAEVVGSVLAVAGGFFAFHLTGNRGIAAISGTVAETIGFYLIIGSLDWRRMRSRSSIGPIAAMMRVLGGMVAEFGPGEIIDSTLTRPVAMYIGPFITGGIATGSLLGKLMADVVFYAVVIVSYEISRTRLRTAPADVLFAPRVVATVSMREHSLNLQKREQQEGRRVNWTAETARRY